MNLNTIDDRLTYYNAKIQLWEHLKKRIQSAQSIRNRERDAMASPASLQGYAKDFRKFMITQLGGIPNVSKRPNVTTHGEIREATFVIQKIIIETRPNVQATASLYLPHTATQKTPAVLLLCGHSAEGRMADRYQVISRIIASRGLIVLALDPTGQGERMNYYDAKTETFSIRPGTGDHEYVGFQCLLQGHNLSRYMVQDAIRAVDFLSEHPLVDASKIGVTGSSGGGTQTSLMMALEPRIAAAAPCVFLTSQQAIFDSGYGQDAEQVWWGFSAAGYDHIDFLAAFAPKPLCVLAVEYDYFPIDETRETVRKARRLWEMFGKSDCLELIEDRSVHQYTDSLGRAAADFFAKHFGVIRGEVKEVCTPLPPRILQCTRSGQVLGDFPESKTIFEENCEAFARVKRDAKKGLEFLRTAVFKDREPVDLNLRITESFPLADITAYSGFWWSQKGLLNSGILLRPTALKEEQIPVTIALWEDGSRSIVAHDAWIRSEIAKGRAILVLNVTGVGPIEPHPFNTNADFKDYCSTFFRINDDLSTLADSFAALRTFDVVRSLDVLEKWGGLNAKDVQIYLHGRYGIYGALASVLTERFSELRWDEPLWSYEKLLTTRFYNNRDVKSLIIPGLLRLADWTDLVRL